MSAPASPVLLYQLGEAPPSVLRAHGGYVEWFTRAWGGPLAVHDGRAPGPPPDLRAYAAVLVSGSPASLVDGEREPWADEAAALVLRARELGTPLFGVCFGLQLAAWALGGTVVRNPRGWEAGRCRVTLESGAHPLLRALPREAWVHQTHRDMADPATLPRALRVLGASERCAVQVVHDGAALWATQFHPEIVGPVSDAYVALKEQALRDEGQDPASLRARRDDADDGGALLRAFRARYVR